MNIEANSYLIFPFTVITTLPIFFSVRIDNGDANWQHTNPPFTFSPHFSFFCPFSFFFLCVQGRAFEKKRKRTERKKKGALLYFHQPLPTVRQNDVDSLLFGCFNIRFLFLFFDKVQYCVRNENNIYRERECQRRL